LSSHDTPVNILQILEDFSELAGGIPRVVKEITKYVSNDHIQMKVLHAKGHTSDSRAIASPPSLMGKCWSWNPNLSCDIRTIATSLPKPALIHIHGVWSGPQLLSGQIAAELNIPFILSAHGMVEPWLWVKQGLKTKLKKQLYWSLFASHCFAQARVIHAITPLERDHLHKLFPKNRIEIIPNAIHVEPGKVLGSSALTQREKIILFIGRIEPKKGVHLLIQAFSESRISKDWRLVILGPSWSTDYMNYLLRLAAESGLQDRIIFKGATFGEEKREWMRKSWILVAPSYSEAIGLVNLEAAANELPAITTYETGLFNWEDGGGLLISPAVEEVKRALEVACSWSPSERDQRGESSKSLVANKYSWDVVAPLWAELYKEV
jgi:glycosyltransferase involved in cell wall biosynthesis